MQSPRRRQSYVASELKSPRTPTRKGQRRPPISPRRPPPVVVPGTPRRHPEDTTPKAPEKSPVKPALLGGTAGFLLTGPIGFVAGALAGAASALTPNDAFGCSGGGGVRDCEEEDTEESRPPLRDSLQCRAPHCRVPSNIPSLQESNDLSLSVDGMSRRSSGRSVESSTSSQSSDLVFSESVFTESASMSCGMEPMRLEAIMLLHETERPVRILHLLLSKPPRETVLRALAALSDPALSPSACRQLLLLGALDFLMPLVLAYHKEVSTFTTLPHSTYPYR